MRNQFLRIERKGITCDGIEDLNQKGCFMSGFDRHTRPIEQLPFSTDSAFGVPELACRVVLLLDMRSIRKDLRMF